MSRGLACVLLIISFIVTACSPWQSSSPTETEMLQRVQQYPDARDHQYRFQGPDIPSKTHEFVFTTTDNRTQIAQYYRELLPEFTLLPPGEVFNIDTGDFYFLDTDGCPVHSVILVLVPQTDGIMQVTVLYRADLCI